MVNNYIISEMKHEDGDTTFICVIETKNSCYVKEYKTFFEALSFISNVYKY